ncbi:MAG: hypothetical protein KDI56_16780, partial [Xanthomonadales bacterium]|nr:hypothetical protein [Xanthomonadales bacterium]
GAGQSATLALLRLPQPPTALPRIEQIGTGERRTIDTGWIEVELDGAASQPLRRLRIREQAGGPLQEIFQAQSGSADEGWRVRIVDTAGNPLLEAAENLPGSLVVDQVRWESGAATVSSLLHIDGHLEGPTNLSRCNGDADWLRFPWSLSLRLTAGSADLAFDWQLGNACGTPQGPQTADTAEIALAEFRLPLLRNASGAQVLSASNGALQLGPGPVSSPHQLLQRRGGGTPWQRRAELRVNGSVQNSASFYDEPGLGLARPLGSGQLIALLAQPWLRYREPQGLSLQGNHVAFQLVAERIRLGKAKSLWFSGRLALQAGVASGNLGSRGQVLHRANLAGVERPLLLRPLPESLDAAAILPPLAGSIDGPVGVAYRQYLQRKHDDTVGDEPCVDAGNDVGSQWTCAKTFGLQLWPDVQFNLQFGFADNPDPASNEGKLNYW